MWRVMLLLWGAVALGAGPVEVEGERVKLDAKEFGTKAPVEVVYRLYTATRGPDKVLVAVGQIRTRLPHEWFKVTVRIRVWTTFTDPTFPLGIIPEVGVATVEIKNPKPAAPVRFIALVRDSKGPVGINAPLPHFSVSEVEWEKTRLE